MSLADDDPYLAQWNVVGKMIRRGSSFSGREGNCCFLNTGGTRFADVSAVTGLDQIDDGRAIALVDWDHDGDLDIWLGSRTGPRVRLMRNNLDTKNRFVQFKLQGNGVTCNRDAIGARLEIHLVSDGGVKSANRKLIKTLRAGEGFVSQSSKWVHFGLGPADSIERLVVKWPDGGTPEAGGESNVEAGNIETYRNLETNRRYSIIQGSGEAKLAGPTARNVTLTPTVPKVPAPSSKARVVLVKRLELPNLSYRDFDGQDHPLSPRNGPLLINLWASWCRPCLKELQEFGQHRTEFEKLGLQVVALCADGLTGEDKGNLDGTDLTAARNIAKRRGGQLQIGLASRGLVRQLTELSHQAVYQHRPLPLPVSFLVDRRGQLALIYKGPVDPEQLLRDLALLDAMPREIERAALPFPGRGSRHLFSDREIDKAIAFRDAGYPDDCQYELRIFLTSKLPQIRAGGGDLDDDARREVGQAYFLLATVEREQGRYPTAVKAYRNALQFLDDIPNARLALFKVLWRTKQRQLAQTELDEVMRRWPHSVQVATAIGQAWLELGQLDKAVEHLDRGVQIDPTNGPARFHLAVALQQQGKVGEALEHYDRLLLDSAVAIIARNNIAWIRSTHADARYRSAEVAVKLAEINARATAHRDPAKLDTLAAAYAEAGRFDRAVATAEKAIVLARASNQEQFTTDLKARLLLYLAKKPYREPAVRER